MEGKICCFGELLLRFSLDGSDQFLSRPMPFYVGGAELNVAAALSNWQLPVEYVSALPANQLSRNLFGYLDNKKIGREQVLLFGNRIGTYYLPVGGEMKHASVIYDRDHSSFSSLLPQSIDWDSVLQGCSWFHFSAITPSLNENLAALCEEAVKAAAAKGLTISVDLNYRSKLWQYGKKPVEVMPRLIKYCHVIMGNLWSVESLLGIPSPVASSNGVTDEALSEASVKSMQSIQKQYPLADSIAFTFRLDDRYWSILRNQERSALSGQHDVLHIVDRVGSGDCFMAGLIYGIYNDFPAEEIIDFATAAAVGKLYEFGDASLQSLMDVNTRIAAGKKINY